MEERKRYMYFHFVEDMGKAGPNKMVLNYSQDLKFEVKTGSTDCAPCMSEFNPTQQN